MNLLGQNEPSSVQPVDDGLVFDVSTMDFEDKVMRLSMEMPVLVDFWAPWCEPCKQLVPLLEEIVTGLAGKIKLAKVNIDDNPELAQALRVQSVPMVFAFYQGQPVNAFVGIKSKSEISAFIDQIVQMSGGANPDDIDVNEGLKEAAEYLNNGDTALAQSIYVQILSQDEHNAAAYAGLIRTFIANDQIEHAQEMINEVSEEIAKDAQFQAAKTALELAQNVPIQDFSNLESKLADNQDDHQVRFDLAESLFSSGQKERAIDELVELIRRNRKWEDEKARLQLLKYFDALGSSDPLTIDGRKKLSSVLFS